MEKHVISKMNELDNMYDIIDDKKVFEHIISSETIKSVEYLQNCLGVE